MILLVWTGVRISPAPQLSATLLRIKTMKIREVYFIGFLRFKTHGLKRHKVAFTGWEPMENTDPDSCRER